MFLGSPRAGLALARSVPRALALLIAVSLLLPLAAAPLWGAEPDSATAGTATPVGLRRIDLRTEGGVPFSVDCYRQPGAVSGGTAVFLPEPADSLAAWEELARLLAGRGYSVFVPQVVVRSATAPLAVWGRPEDPGAPWAAAWEEVAAVLAHAEAADGPGGSLLLGGTGLGAAAAVVAASRLSHPPAAFLLVAPVRELTGLPVGPLLAGLGVPALVVAPTGNAEKAYAAREIHLAARSICRLWMIDAYAFGPRSLHVRPKLAIDMADWVGRQLPGAIPATNAGTPLPKERESR